ncbi:MAG: NAD(P)/FAD-dependent oxidoreductase [Cytophagales bacterium]
MLPKLKTETIYDVAIIGGGLAGLTLSIQLVQKNLKVILFEKETYPFHKVCGEYISMESWDFLTRCGLDLEAFNLPQIKKLNVTAPNGNVLSHNLDLGGFGISRYKLDAALAAIATKNGVELLQNSKVDDVVFVNDEFAIIANQQIYKSKLAAGSFGKRSNIDIKLDRKFIQKPQQNAFNYVGVKYHIKLHFPSDLIELHNFEDGYCGISKVEGDTYCLCYLTSANNLRKYGNIKNMEEKALMKNPFLKKYFNEAEFLYSEPLVISQVNFSAKKAIENHILMVGDAAGLITPLCGNGMSMAMHGSFLLSRQIEGYFSGKYSRLELEKNYVKAWKQQFSLRLFIGRLIQYSFGRPEITNPMIAILKYFPSFVKRLIKLTHGKPF